MNFGQGLAGLILTGAMFLGLGNKVNAELYDDFSSPTLNINKWEVRQDTQGQPLMDEGFVTNGVFHTEQLTMGDRRIYLVPKFQFKTGDVIEYDVDVISRQGTYANMVLLTGDQYIRIGMRGPAAGFDELGVAHMRLEFQPNNLIVTRTQPSGNVLIDNLSLNNPNGLYELYIGSFTGSDGLAHMDYDNVDISTIPEPSTFGLVGAGSLALFALRKRKKK